MSDCTNKRLREKLFAYELAALDDEERRELEEHLYECDACYNDLDQFADWAEYLRDEKSVRDSVLSDVDQPESGSKKIIVTRLLISFAAVLVLSIPAYYYWFKAPDIEIIQKLTLVPSRATGSGVVDLKLGGDVQIDFVAEGALPGHSYVTTISPRGGTEVYREVFSDFRESGQGSLVLPVETLEAGFYLLSVIDTSSSPPAALVEYIFRVE